MVLVNQTIEGIPFGNLILYFSSSLSVCWDAWDAKTVVASQPYTLLPIRLGDRLRANRKQDRRKGKPCSKQEMRGRINLKPTLIFASNEESINFSTQVPGYGSALTQTFMLSANLNAYFEGEENPITTAGVNEHVSFSQILSHFGLLLCSLLFPAPSNLLGLSPSSGSLSLFWPG